MSVKMKLYFVFIVWWAFGLGCAVDPAATGTSGVVYKPVPVSQTQSFLIVFELNHSFATKSQIVTDNGWQTMNQASETTFWYETDLPNGTYSLNIATTNDQGLFRYLINYWGIRAATMTINGASIDKTYIKQSVTLPMGVVSFDLLNGAVTPAAGTTVVTDDRTPPELSFHRAYVRYLTPADVPGGGFAAALPWMQALHLNPDITPSTVEVDSLQ